jgi:endonuclease/exonuclease/phosphatase family metal-dependent hydrolase
LKPILSKILFRLNIVAAALLGLSYLAVYVNPQYFWPIAFMGLMYPYLVIINIVFAIIWAIRLKPQIFLSLGIILVGWFFIIRYVQIENPFKKKEQAIAQKSFKILSFNVRHFNRYKWLKNRDISSEIFQFIEKESPDIICFQDFFTRYTGELSENEIAKRLGKTKYYHIKYRFSDPKASSFGIATFSKYPIVHKGEILFENSYNLSIYTDILMQDDTVRIFNNHLQSIRFLKQNYDFMDTLKLKYNQGQVNGIVDIAKRLKWAFEQRATQAEAIAAQIHRSPYPVIVCGDFNDSPVSYTYQIIHKNLKDAFVEAGSGFGNTYLGKFPSYRIDYVLHDKKFSVFNYRTPKLDLSDHYPVLCRMFKK